MLPSANSPFCGQYTQPRTMKNSIFFSALTFLFLISSCQSDSGGKSTLAEGETSKDSVAMATNNAIPTIKPLKTDTSIYAVDDITDGLKEQKATAIKSDARANNQDIHSKETKQVQHKGLAYLMELDEEQPTVSYISCREGGVVEGRQGSLVTIPHDAFVRSDGKPVSGQVKVVVDEFLSISRSIQNGLGTMSGDRILETGGMLKITAQDREGNELELGKDKEIELKIPTRDLKRGMQTFIGSRKNGNVDWLPLGNEISERYGFNQRDMSRIYPGKYVRRATFPGGARAMSVYISNYLEYPADAGRKNITGSCTFEFTVTAGGETKNIHLLGNPFPSFAHKGRRLLGRMHFYPAFSKEGEFVSSDNMKITFFFQPESVIDRDYKWADFQEEYDNFVKSGIIADEYYQGILLEVEGKMDSLGTTQVAMKGRGSRGVMYNILSSRRLGWINCDRYLNTGLPLANVALEVDNPGDKAFFLVLKETRSILPGDKVCNGNQICFPNIPIGYTYKIIGVEKREGVPYLVEHQGVVEAGGTPMKLELKEAKTEEVKEALSRLNYFHGVPI